MSGPNAEDGYGATGMSRVDVMATVVAHVDRGDGYCAGLHHGTPPLAPCKKRLYFETVLRDMDRRP